MSLLRTLRALRERARGKAARFILSYAPPDGGTVTVGELAFDGKMWTFRYDDAYRSRHDLRPIEGFDDRDKVYRSSVLFPFFAVRIPDIDRTDIRRKLDEAGVRDPAQTDLLRLFGRHVVSSPAFELRPA